MKTYTPTKFRQNLFEVLKQSNQQNSPIQITCQRRNKLSNSNYYVLNQRQYQKYLNDKKRLTELKSEIKVHNLAKKIVKSNKPMSEKEFKREFNA